MLFRSVYYDALLIYNETKPNSIDKYNSPYEVVRTIIEEKLQQVRRKQVLTQRTISIPVCYGGEFGPDLEYVAHTNHLTTDEVIHFHSKGEYLVYMIGFAPGFPFLGGLSEKIVTPRRSSPRMSIPAGSVGIAGKQTGVYSISTPGGWQLIGRTPSKLFLPNEIPPSLLQAGDKVEFVSISPKEYREMFHKERLK